MKYEQNLVHKEIWSLSFINIFFLSKDIIVFFMILYKIDF